MSLLFLESFHKHHLEIDLTQACVGELNTIQRGEINWPIIYGVGVNIKTGEIFPATFPDKGPDLQLRLARNFTGGQSGQSVSTHKEMFEMKITERFFRCGPKFLM